MSIVLGLSNGAYGALISEVRIDQPSTDNDEYFELAGDAGESLDNLTYLVIGDGSTGSGTIESVTSLDGYNLSPSGFFVAAESTFTLAAADLTTTLGFENSDNVTHVLVSGFTGALGDDLDTDDDGTLDILPWLGVIDAVGLVETPTSGDAFYGAALGGTDIGPDGSFVPGHVCRTATGFEIGAFDPAAGTDTPGSENACSGPSVQEVRIHEIQGSGDSVALSGLVQVEAIVTTIFERDDVLDGFFIQEEDLDADGDPATSEGIFVYCRGSCPESLSVGALVTVTGTATDFFNMSQIDATGSDGEIVIEAVDVGGVTPTNLALPASGATNVPTTFEAVEGMLVRFPDTLAVSEYFQLGRYGQIVLTLAERPDQFTHTNLPSTAGYAAHLEQLATRRIILDDLDNDQNGPISDGPDEAVYLPTDGFSVDNIFRGGDTITGLTGVLHWSFAGQSGTDAWRVRPVAGEPYVFDENNPRTEAPSKVAGRLKIASFNVLNYFTTLDEPGAVCGPSALGCRGAHSEAELARQTAKIVDALQRMQADVVGLIEIENDDRASVAALVDALNQVSQGTYGYIDTGAIGGDAIKVAFIYRTDHVKPMGDFALLDSSVDARFIDTKNRPMLAQTFMETSTRARFTAVVGHLKSKGSDCEDVGDPDLLDGQGNCNATRTAAAQALADWLATDPTGAKDADVLILGDLNAYAMEDPIAALQNAGYTDLLNDRLGADAYSYVFDGQLGYLDHALASKTMNKQVTGVSVWHINADEVHLLDYNDEVRDAAEASFERESSALPLYAADAYRSSDHDPVIVGLTLKVSPDVDGDGCVSRRDLVLVRHGIILYRVFGKYDPALDMNGDSKLSYNDLRIVFKQFSRPHGSSCARK